MKSKYYESEKFAKVMSFINAQGQRCTLKQTDKNLILMVKQIPSLNKGMEFLKQCDN
ncbi:MAG: hypothetical protein RL065_348 [Bacteroidota bacterium]|jgi:hypothetical protein